MFGVEIAKQLEQLVNRVDRDPSVHAVVFTGARPGRFVSHADVRWLQEEGAAVPPLGRRGASLWHASRGGARPCPRARWCAGRRCGAPSSFDRLHATFLKMNASGVIFVAALNGSALGLGAEFAWACDLRVMADGEFFIGQPEVLLGINPGVWRRQRLTADLVGTHRSLVAILEGKPFTPAQALANGAVDEVVAPDHVVTRATELAEHFGKRTKGAVAAIKRAVYFGGSMSLSEGLHVERTEFLQTDQSEVGQALMLDYLATTEATGELPLYQPDTYAQALESGRVPRVGATNGAVGR